MATEVEALLQGARWMQGGLTYSLGVPCRFLFCCYRSNSAQPELPAIPLAGCHPPSASPEGIMAFANGQIQEPVRPQLSNAVFNFDRLFR